MYFYLYHVICSRFYPKASRIMSSNMDPVPMWAVGGQCAALNYQTPGPRNRLNDCKFFENNRCGYVAKPLHMTQILKTMSSKVRLTLRVISAQRLPKPDSDLKGEVIDPYVIVQIAEGMTGITSPTTEKTKIVKNNGFNPIWNQVFEFDIMKPETSFLYMTVMDDDGLLENDDFIAFTSAPIHCLAAGFRHFQLYDNAGWRKGDHIYATLFCQIQINSV